MQEFLMKPKIDFAFKEIMADEKARTGFISAVLGMPQEEIRESRLLDTHLRKKNIDDKLGILDIRVQLHDGTEIDIEIQIAKLSVWAERSLFYVSKMYADQIKPGDEYGLLNKCVSISILDFELFEDSDEFYSCFHILEDNRNTLLTDKMEFHIIELPKLPKEIQSDGSKLTLWAKFINAERKEDFDMIAEKDECIESAYQRLQNISLDEQKRFEYEARDRAIRDHKQFMSDISKKIQEIKKGIHELENGRHELENGRQELENDRQELENGRQELENGRQELENGRHELENDRQELEKSRQESIKEGERQLALLIERLTDDGRMDDIHKVLADSDIREELYKEYGIKAML